MTTPYKEAFESSPIAMILVTPDSKIHLINRYAENLFGYEHGELINQPIEKLVPQAVRDKHPQMVKAFFDSPITRQMGSGRDLFAIRKDNTQFPVEVGLSPIQSGDGMLVMSSIIDLTQRLKERDRFSAAFDAAPNGMLMIDSHGTIIMTNNRTEQMFGYTKEELVGQPIELLVPDEFKSPHPNFVKNYIAEPKPRAMGIGRELFGQRKDGTKIPVEIGLQPAQTDGELFVITSIVDITYRRASEAALQQKTEELEEFAYRTSHDLRTPLITISGLTDCVLEDLAEQEYAEVAENAEKISAISAQLQNLVSMMLTLTKTDLKQDEDKPFGFDEFIKSFLIKYGKNLEDHGVQLESTLTHTADCVVQNTRLTQVLENLIANAVKYSDPDKDNRSVALRTFNDLEYFHIQIQDNGLGIPEAEHDNVFGMFKRFHESSASGSGLGLYMVRRHIDKISANITFSSSPQGTTFYLRLPLKKEIQALSTAATCPVL